MRFTSPQMVLRHPAAFRLVGKLPYGPLRSLLLVMRRRELATDAGEQETTACREDVLRGLRKLNYGTPDDLAERYVSYAHCERDIDLFTLAVKLENGRFRKRNLKLTGLEYLHRLGDGQEGAVLACTTFGPFAMIPPLLMSLGFDVVAGSRREAADLYGNLAASLVKTPLGSVHLLRTEDTGILVRGASALKRGKMMALYCEVGGQERTRTVEVAFLGKQVSVSAGPAALARSAKAPLVPLALFSRDGDFELEVSHPLYPSSTAELTSRMMAVVEGWVLREPHQWYGWHRIADAVLDGSANSLPATT